MSRGLDERSPFLHGQLFLMAQKCEKENIVFNTKATACPLKKLSFLSRNYHITTVLAPSLWQSRSLGVKLNLMSRGLDERSPFLHGQLFLMAQKCEKENIVFNTKATACPLKKLSFLSRNYHITTVLAPSLWQSRSLGVKLNLMSRGLDERSPSFTAIVSYGSKMRKRKYRFQYESHSLSLKETYFPIKKLPYNYCICS